MPLPKPLLLASAVAAALGSLSRAAVAAPAPAFEADDARTLDGMTVEGTPISGRQTRDVFGAAVHTANRLGQ